MPGKFLWHQQSPDPHTWHNDNDNDAVGKVVMEVSRGFKLASERQGQLGSQSNILQLFTQLAAEFTISSFCSCKVIIATSIILQMGIKLNV